MSCTTGGDRRSLDDASRTNHFPDNKTHLARKGCSWWRTDHPATTVTTLDVHVHELWFLLLSRQVCDRTAPPLGSRKHLLPPCASLLPQHPVKRGPQHTPINGTKIRTKRAQKAEVVVLSGSEAGICLVAQVRKLFEVQT
jgi:hypothetical protein